MSVSCSMHFLKFIAEESTKKNMLMYSYHRYRAGLPVECITECKRYTCIASLGLEPIMYSVHYRVYVFGKISIRIGRPLHVE
jgi:hypothetical protein